MDQFLDEHPGFDAFIKSLGGTSDMELGLDVVLIRLLAACVIGWVIGQVYRRTFTGKKFGATLPDTHMLLCLGGALIWLVVGSSLVRAFGLAGTIGLIRYRTIVRDPKDTTVLLFSMVLGMACGLGQYPVAVVGTVVVIFTLLWLYHSDQKLRAEEAKKSKDLMDLLKDDNEPPPRLPGDKL
ncbi:MAG: hypothetical protein AMXMBFR13_46440 [Phycisphaerae bacterium]